MGLLMVLVLGGEGAKVVISNVEGRVDVDGRPMDVHDGNIVQWTPGPGQLYYWYGIGYGLCNDSKWGCDGEFHIGDCGFRVDHAVNLYVSKDLASWRFVGNVLPADSRPVGIYYRPKVVYNAKTRMYVLWVNLVHKDWIGPNFADTSYVVAVSPAPEGPFVVSNPSVSTLLHGNPGDFDILVDDDGSAYLAYDAFNNFHVITIEQLTDDYQETLGANATSGDVSGLNNEAPMMFKRQGWYYLLFGQCCCFCRTGSNSQLVVSKSALGPFVDPGVDIDPYSGPYFSGHSVTHGQESFVIQVSLVNNETGWIFAADRWGSALDGYMGHDLQFWEPLIFNDTTYPPTINTLVWMDSFTIDIGV
uniref:Glycosyl hydrolase family 43 protein n=1 Tax=Arcella intermedia TaxID=1963864 RepID=A0A6B2L7W1_9EUKA